MSVRLGRFIERSGVLPTTKFAYRKGQGTCHALLCLSQTLQSVSKSGQEARIGQIDFSAAFDRVNHQGTLYKLCSVGIGGSVLSILTQFLSNLSQHVTVDGCRSKLVDVVSGVSQGSVLGPLFFLLYTSELFSILKNKLIGYAADSTLMAVVPSPGVRVIEAETPIRDLGRVSEWCDLFGIKLNSSKTKTMIVFWSCTIHPQSPPLTIIGTVMKESDDLIILRLTFILSDSSAVWCSAADTHLELLERAVCGARFLTGGVFECDIAHRRSVAVLRMLNKIRCNR